MIVCYVILRRQIYKIISNNQIKKNRFIFQNIFILQFYFLKIRMFFRLNRKILIYHFTNTTRRRLFYPFIKRLLSTEMYLTKIIVLHYKEMRQQTNQLVIKISFSVRSGSPFILRRIWATVRVSRSQYLRMRSISCSS